MTPAAPTGDLSPEARRGRALRVLLVVLAAIVAIPVAIGFLLVGMGERR